MLLHNWYQTPETLRRAAAVNVPPPNRNYTSVSGSYALNMFIEHIWWHCLRHEMIPISLIMYLMIAYRGWYYSGWDTHDHVSETKMPKRKQNAIHVVSQPSLLVAWRYLKGYVVYHYPLFVLDLVICLLRGLDLMFFLAVYFSILQPISWYNHAQMKYVRGAYFFPHDSPLLIVTFCKHHSTIHPPVNLTSMPFPLYVWE